MVSRAIVLFLGGILGAAAMFCFMVTPCEGKDDLSLSPPLDGAMEPPSPTDLPQTKVKMVKGWSDIPGSGNGVIPISFCQVEIEGKVATIVDAEDVTVVYPPNSLITISSLLSPGEQTLDYRGLVVGCFVYNLFKLN